MTPDQRVLHEAERWFRSKLRGDSLLLDHELPLFIALAKRRDSSVDVYVPRDRENEPAPPSSTHHAPSLPTTQPPPPDIQRELVRISRTEVAAAARRR